MICTHWYSCLLCLRHFQPLLDTLTVSQFQQETVYLEYHKTNSESSPVASQSQLVWLKHKKWLYLNITNTLNVLQDLERSKFNLLSALTIRLRIILPKFCSPIFYNCHNYVCNNLVFSAIARVLNNKINNHHILF